MKTNIGNPRDDGWLEPGNPVEGFQGQDYSANNLAIKASEALTSNLQQDLLSDRDIVSRITCLVRITKVVELDNGMVEYKAIEIEHYKEDKEFDVTDRGLVFDTDLLKAEDNLVEVLGAKDVKVGTDVVATKASIFGDAKWVFQKPGNKKQYLVKLVEEIDVDGCKGYYKGVQVKRAGEGCGYEEIEGGFWWGLLEEDQDEDPCRLPPLKEKDCKSGLPAGTIVLPFLIEEEGCDINPDRGNDEESEEVEDEISEEFWIFEEDFETYACLTLDNATGSYEGKEVYREPIFQEWVVGSPRSCDTEAMNFDGYDFGELYEINDLFGAEDQIVKVSLVQDSRGNEVKNKSSFVFDLGGFFMTEVVLKGCGENGTYDWVQLQRGQITSQQSRALADEVNGQKGLDGKRAHMLVSANKNGSVPFCSVSLKATDLINACDSGFGLVKELEDNCEDPFKRKIKGLIEGDCITISDDGDCLTVSWDESCKEDESDLPYTPIEDTDTVIINDCCEEPTRNDFNCNSCFKSQVFGSDNQAQLIVDIGKWVVEQGFDPCGRPPILNFTAQKEAGKVRFKYYGVACYKTKEGDTGDPKNPDKPTTNPTEPGNDPDVPPVGPNIPGGGGGGGKKPDAPVRPQPALDCTCPGGKVFDKSPVKYGKSRADVTFQLTSWFAAKKANDPNLKQCSSPNVLANPRASGNKNRAFYGVLCYRDKDAPDQLPGDPLPPFDWKPCPDDCSQIIGQGTSASGAKKNADKLLREAHGGEPYKLCRVPRLTGDCKTYRNPGETKRRTACEFHYCYKLTGDIYDWDCTQIDVPEESREDWVTDNNVKACRCTCGPLFAFGEEMDSLTDAKNSARDNFISEYGQKPCKVIKWKAKYEDLQRSRPAKYVYKACGDQSSSPEDPTSQESLCPSCQGGDKPMLTWGPVRVNGKTFQDMEDKVVARWRAEVNAGNVVCSGDEVPDFCQVQVLEEPGIEEGSLEIAGPKGFVGFVCYYCSEESEIDDQYPDSDCGCGEPRVQVAPSKEPEKGGDDYPPDEGKDDKGEPVIDDVVVPEKDAFCDKVKKCCPGCDTNPELRKTITGTSTESGSGGGSTGGGSSVEEVSKYTNDEDCIYVKYVECNGSRCLIVHRDKAAKFGNVIKATKDLGIRRSVVCFSRKGECCAERETLAKDWTYEPAKNCSVCKINPNPYTPDGPDKPCGCDERFLFRVSTEAEAQVLKEQLQSGSRNPCEDGLDFTPCSEPKISKSSNKVNGAGEGSYVVEICGTCDYDGFTDTIDSEKCDCGDEQSNEMVVGDPTKDAEDIRIEYQNELYFCDPEKNPSSATWVSPCDVKVTETRSEGPYKNFAVSVCWECGYSKGDRPYVIDEPTSSCPWETILSVKLSGGADNTSYANGSSIPAGKYSFEIKYLINSEAVEGNVYVLLGYENRSEPGTIYPFKDQDFELVRMGKFAGIETFSLQGDTEITVTGDMERVVAQVFYEDPLAPICQSEQSFYVDDNTLQLKTVTGDTEEGYCYDICQSSTDDSSLPYILEGVAGEYYKVEAFINGTKYVGTPGEIRVPDSGVYNGLMRFAQRLSPNTKGKAIVLRATQTTESSNFKEISIPICCRGVTTTTNPCSNLESAPEMYMEDRCYQSNDTGATIGILMIDETDIDLYDVEIDQSSVPLILDQSSMEVSLDGSDLPMDFQPITFTVKMTDPCATEYEETFTVFPCDGPEDIVWKYVLCNPDLNYEYEEL